MKCLDFKLKLGNKDLPKIAISLQLALIGLIALDELGLGIPILRQVIGFLYLTFVPGFLILSILKIDKLNLIDRTLYSIGISLFFVMVLGTLVNFVYPLAGLYPFSEQPITVTFMIAILTLCIISWRYGNKEDIIKMTVPLFSPIVLLLLLLPILAVLGTFSLYYYQNNTLTLLLLLFISVTPFIFALKESEITQLLAIWVITISLTLSNSLFGHYVHVTDNISEICLLQNVLRNKIWDITIPGNINAMPGVMVTLPIYSLISGLNLVWIYKIIVPILSSSVPLGLFKAYEKKFGGKIAFLSTLFFVFQFNFFLWSSMTMKMVSSGIFLSCLVLLMVSNEISIADKKILGIIFSIGLILSHYGTSYIFLLALIVSLLLSFTLNEIRKKHYHIISPSFITTYIVVAISWYIYASGGYPFTSFVLLGQHFIQRITTEFLFPETYGTQLLLGKFPEYLEVLKYLYVISYMLMCLGAFSSLWRAFKVKELDEHMLISLSLLPFIPLPYIFGVGQYGGGRAWLIPSYFLAPFLVVGCLSLSKLKVFFDYDKAKNGMIFTSVFLCIFFLFNSCFLAEVIWKYNIGPSIYVSAPRITKDGTIYEREYLDRVYLSVRDMKSAEWLSRNMKDNTTKVFSGHNAIARKLSIAGLTPKYGSNVITLSNKTEISKNSYIYLSEFNTNTGKIDGRIGAFPKFFSLTEISEKLNSIDKIYTNGRSEIYYKP